MSNQENVRAQIKNRCERISILIEKNAPPIILENELRGLNEAISEYKPGPTLVLSEEELGNVADLVMEAIINKKNKQ